MDTLAEEVKKRIQDRFGENTSLNFHDERNDGRHFALAIISPVFIGKSRVERSQLVYEILGDLIGDGSIHALRMQCKTPAEV